MTALGPAVDHLEAALGYAHAGLELFPADPANKAPLGEFAPQAFKSATNDPATVADWWTRRPDALIACRVPANIIILDVDPRHDGDKVIDALETEFGPLPRTRTHWSGRGDGGCHLWFQHPGVTVKQGGLNKWATANGVGEILHDKDGKQRTTIIDGETVPARTSGLDLLHRDLRYTILPPSLHPDTGRPYEWSDTDVMPAAMPPWLLDLITEPVATPAAPSTALTLPASAHRPPLESVADWFSDTQTWAQLLAEDGWHLISGNGDEDGSKWRHPTATAAWSATVRHGCLFVYSPTPGLPVTEPGDTRGITRFAYLTHARHHGNGSAAADAARGYTGAPQLPQPAGTPPATTNGDDDGLAQATMAPVGVRELPIYWGDEIGNLPPPTPLVEGLVDEGALCVVYGAPGSGKSFWAISLALHITSGMPSFHGRAIPDPGRPVAYLAAEGVAGLGRRQAAWVAHHSGDETAVDVGPIAWLPTTIDLRTTASIAELDSVIERTDACMLIVDTLNRNAPGTDEGAQDMGLIVNTLDHLRAMRPGLTTMIVHHTGKDAARGSRGHSSLLGAVDTEISISKIVNGIEVNVTKQKEGPALGPWTFGLEPAGDSVAIATTVRSSSTAMADLQGRYLQTIVELGDSVSAGILRDELALERGAEYRVAADLERDGLIENTGTTSRRQRTITEAGRARLRLWLAHRNPEFRQPKEGTPL